MFGTGTCLRRPVLPASASGTGHFEFARYVQIDSAGACLSYGAIHRKRAYSYTHMLS